MASAGRPAAEAAPPGPSGAPPAPAPPGAPPAPGGWGSGAYPGALAPVAPPSTGRRLAGPLVTLAGVAAAFAYVGSVDPNEPGHYPVCPLLSLTGVLCPGCGGLRSAHAFVHGDLPTALGANAAAVAGYLVFAVLWVMWLVHAVRGRPFRPRVSPLVGWSAGAVLVVFAVVRNLPFGAALAP
ncbi:DUF2752 domain-containing protein [Streptomyces genisteinicus]|uniref:DUF2752 domain-containing protein n=1 Tax=Streptomyces genisteinicus TaxID=2768068 RepID=A0A7H0HQJ4_9ACTN|nr:DUF2752 domain-containing protein [Streptomyces genisteinicus]QNP62810.1 DUF2752 domain-containing protein [Streptomyces genisteinicus]